MAEAMGTPHALAIPFPAQGHVIPLMELSHCLAERGFKITFVNTEFIHERLIKALPEDSNIKNQIHLVSIPDGLGPGGDRSLRKLCECIPSAMPSYLEELIAKINESSKDKITCIIADEYMGWAVKVAKKMGIPQAAFWPANACLRALLVLIPQLIEEGIIDAYGITRKQEMIQLSSNLPVFDTTQLPWHCFDGLVMQQTVFHHLFTNNQVVKDTDWLLCNSFYEIESSAYPLDPNLLPIGPLLAGSRQRELAGNFWPEDSTCLSWLNQQPSCSVIYVAFGSFTVLDQTQFHELALGLELTGLPFLWVVRPDLTAGQAATYPDGFQARVAARGRMVEMAEAMGTPHALAIPFPAQGHVIPLMELSHCLAERGFKITFVNTEFIHERLIKALPEDSNIKNQIHLVSIPDGLGPGGDRSLRKLCECIPSAMPSDLEELIAKINESSKDKITCIIADEYMGWAVKVAKKMGIPQAAFWPANACLRALLVLIPQLIEEGIIDANGITRKQEMIQLSSNLPVFDTTQLPWHCFDGLVMQQTVFHHLFTNNQVVKDTDWLLCNSFYEIESSAYPLNPNLLPIGPLLAGSRQRELAGNFWPEDSTCLSWLNQQPSCSVIYVAFGSFTVLDQTQFHELALGLELTGLPFLWVVRPDLTAGQAATYPDGFQARVAARGRMGGWVPQQKVLAHPSIACFLTHCGWNSTMEGLSTGVPFLCWPYFADQFLNQAYIYDVWKVGLQLNSDDNGIISKEEIKKKVEAVLGDEKIRTRALALKEMAKNSVSEGGSSMKNLNDFVEAMKGK
ncbi:hypothetical protein HHK36_030146 [Tetracentron sinense]|uniref:Uncharacterized protein n=1 Tax=Tetracentron sinense TaxID=13715 RepID=A0A834YF69_TETSI|nr:hypothetical protein HHK36_030146 [Tetracentron sinense]